MIVASHQPPNHPSPALRAPSPLLGRGERDGVRGALPGSRAAAFTLVEMLVVLGIIGVLAAMTVPSFTKAGKKGDALESATRQLQDDLAYARLKAMSGRTKVYVVFLPDLAWFGAMTPAQTNYLFTNQAANSVVGGQLTSYAIFAPRQVGDQPGQSTPRYLTEWHTLPDGAFIPYSAFFNTNIFHNLSGSPLTNAIPVEESPTAWAPLLPFIAFDEQGRLHRHPGPVTLPVIQGSVQHPKDTNGVRNIVVPTDAIETAAPVPAGGIVPNIEYLVAGAPGSTVRYPPGGTIYTAGQSFLGTLAGGTNFAPAGGSPRVVELYGVRLDPVTGRGRAIRPELP
jgi:prepilin-type N-terminal cleavage/methylation domain-containing protein